MSDFTPYANPYTNGEAYANYQLVCQKVEYRKQTRDDHWKQVLDYLWGDHNIRSTTMASENDFVYNLIRKDHRLVVSMLARDRPNIMIRALTPRVMDQAEALTTIVNHVYEANDAVALNTEVVAYGAPLGTSYLKIGWEGSMRMGLGDFILRAPDPRNIYFIPGIGRVKNSLVLSEKMTMDKLTAMHQYGKTPGDREAINWLFKKSRPGNEHNSTSGEYTNVVAEGYQSRLWNDMRKKDDRPSIDIWQQWVIDSTVLKDIPELFERLQSNKAYKALRSDQKDMMAHRPLYPRGKVVIFAEDHLFNSRVSAFPSFPYSQYVHEYLGAMKPGDEFPPGEYDQMLEVQDAYGEVKNRNKDKLDSAGTRTFVTGEVDKDEWAANPNGIFPLPQGADAKPIHTPGPTPEMMKAETDLFLLARELQNRSDISQGQNPSGARSGEQVAELSELANRVMVTQSHSLEVCHKGAVRHIIGMVGQGFYRRGVHYEDTVDLMGASPDAFEIIVKAGLNLPATESQKMVWLRMLAELKAIDARTLLENVPDTILPNKKAVIQRMEEKYRAEQQAIENEQEANVQNTRAQTQKTAVEASNVVPMQTQAVA